MAFRKSHDSDGQIEYEPKISKEILNIIPDSHNSDIQKESVVLEERVRFSSENKKIPMWLINMMDNADKFGEK